MKKFTINILSSNKQLCTLIKKALDEETYTVTCSYGEDLLSEYWGNVTGTPDCIILDNNLASSLLSDIKKRFKDVNIICLPALNYEANGNQKVMYMKEPFRLSELQQAVKDLTE